MTLLLLANSQSHTVMWQNARRAVLVKASELDVVPESDMQESMRRLAKQFSETWLTFCA